MTVASALDQGGSGGHVRQLAMWERVYWLLEATANDRRHDLAGGWLELGLSVPHARPDGYRAHEEVASLEAAKSQPKSHRRGEKPAPCRRRRQLAKASSRCGETVQLKSSSRDSGAKVQRAKKARDLLEVRPARPRDCVRQFPRHQSGSPVFLALVSSFSRETDFTKFVGEEIATRLEAASDPDARQPAPSCALQLTATKHEPGLSPSSRVVSYGSAVEAWALLMRRLSYYLRTRRYICRDAGLASHLDPVAFSGDKRGCSNSLL